MVSGGRAGDEGEVVGLSVRSLTLSMSSVEW